MVFPKAWESSIILFPNYSNGRIPQKKKKRGFSIEIYTHIYVCIFVFTERNTYDYIAQVEPKIGNLGKNFP